MPINPSAILNSIPSPALGHAACRSINYSESRARNTFYSSPTCRRVQNYSFRDSFVSQNPWGVSSSVFTSHYFRQIPLNSVTSLESQQEAVNELLHYVLDENGLGVAVQSLTSRDRLPPERTAEEILNLSQQARMAYCPGLAYLYVSLFNYLNLAAQVVLIPPSPTEPVGHLAAMLTLTNSSGQTRYVFDPMINRNSVQVNPQNYVELSAREVMAWHLNNQAVNAHNSGNNPEAFRLLNSALEFDPQNPYLYANRFLWCMAEVSDAHRPTRAQAVHYLQDARRALALKPELATELMPQMTRLQALLRSR